MSKTLRPFTSESVSEGHPDKLCDQISDAVLDACLEKDRHSRVACECFATTGLVLVGGEITTRTYVDIQEVARKVVREIGYDDPAYGLDWASMAVLNSIHNQSPDIAQGVEGHGLKEYEGKQGAATRHDVRVRLRRDAGADARPHHSRPQDPQGSRPRPQGQGDSWLRPDGKSQVTVEYEGNKPVRISAVVLSQQHDEFKPSGAVLPYDEIRSTLIDKVITPILGPTGLLDAATRYYINPTGRFVIAARRRHGPHGPQDHRRQLRRHGAAWRRRLLGQDPSKVDRSAAYMARYVAKNIVAAGLAQRCELQVAYAHRRARTRVGACRDLRHRQGGRSGDRRRRDQGIRPVAARIIETLQLKNPSIGRPPPMGISAAKNFPGRRPTRWKLC